MSAHPPPATCQAILAAEIQRQRVYGLTPTRDMFHPDTANAYPGNMATAVSSNLLPHPGAATNAVPQNNQLATNTELTYHSILVADWARAKGGSLLPDYSDASNWAPHTLNSNPGYVSSCQEWVYRKWWSPYGGPSWVQDQLAACGVNGSCLLTTALESPDSPFWQGPPTVTVPATPARPSANGWTSVPIAYRQSTYVPRNPFYEVNGALFENQDSAIALALRNGASSCAQGLQGPFTPDPSNDTNFVPTKYTDANTAANVAKLESMMFAPPVYVIEPATPPAGWPVQGQFTSEWQMVTTLWGERILPGIPGGLAAAYAQDDPFEVAMRDRVQHLRELLALYASLTHFTCADVAAAYPNSGGTGSGGTSSGGATGGGGGGCGSAFGCGGGGGPPKPAPQIATSSTFLDDRITAARAVQDEIVSFMLEEYDRGEEGCFGAQQTACDVDPFEVTGRLVASFDAPQEADFRSCVQWTGNNFGTLPVSGVDTLIQQRMNAAKQRLLNAPGVDPASDASISSPVPIQSSTATTPMVTTQTSVKRDAVGQVITGSRYMGDPDLAGGGYSYGAYWKVTPNDFVGPPGVSGTPTACELDGAVHGELHGQIDLLRSIGDDVCGPVDDQLKSLAAQGYGFGSQQVTSAIVGAESTIGSIAAAFGIPDVVSFCEARYRLRHLADAYLTAKAVPGKVSYDGELFFGGTQLWAPMDAAASPNITASWPADPVKVQGPETTIVVVVVPITFDLYGEIQYGASGFADAGSIVSCTNPTLEAHVGFTPWVTVDAIGSVGIGFSFAQAGIRGKIRVLDAKLPVDARVAVQPDPSTGNLELVAGAHANLQLTMMSGSLSAFAELNLGVVDEEAEVQLASWDGLRTTVPILNWDLQPIALPAFDQSTWNQFQTTTQQGQ
jgi:hypothetical protein